MSRKRLSSGSTFERDIAYSRAVIDGDWIFVSGTTGYDYTTMTLPEGLVAQTEQCLKTIQLALEEADSSLADVVRVLYILPEPETFSQCWPILRAYFGEVRPAATMISAGLIAPDIKIEIQVTALRQNRPAP